MQETMQKVHKFWVQRKKTPKAMAEAVSSDQQKKTSPVEERHKKHIGPGNKPPSSPQHENTEYTE